MGEFTTKGIHFKKHTDKEVIEALQNTHGIITQAANKLGIGRSCLRNRINAHPELYKIMMEAREEIIDLAESVMIQKLQSGDANMAQFVLRTLGANRGYIDEHRFTAKIETTVESKYDFSKLSLEDKLNLEKILNNSTGHIES
jgi:hypothetical protein